MIEKVMNASLEMFDESEIYYKEQKTTKVIYGNCDLKDIESKSISGVMLRVKKQRKLGSASATTLDDPEVILAEARASAENGAQIPYSFSSTKEFPEVGVHSKDAEDYPTAKMIEMCERAKKDVLKELPDISVNLSVEKDSEKINIATSGGTRAEHKGTSLVFVVSAPIKGTGTSIYRFKSEFEPFGYPRDKVDEFITRYRWTEKKVTAPTKRMPILWDPGSLNMFSFSFCSGISGEALFNKTSPLMNKHDKKIFSDKITLLEDPHTPRPGARAFDDEGVPTEKRNLIDKGVLKSYLLDLRTGAKLGARSSGNGFKLALFGSGVTMMPNPWPASLYMEPGTSTFHQMLESIDEGIWLTGGIGFHSSNYEQGDISIQARGYMIADGKVTGRLDGTMVSGNIYKDFLKIRAVSAEVEPSDFGYYPYVLVDSMQVIGE
ncbi:TldD/PmbA family protein [candidate division WOR-3 bacterium]|nr:TldD/PmbA family protein [candidate division WOR-3 bacterium]